MNRIIIFGKTHINHSFGHFEASSIAPTIIHKNIQEEGVSFNTGEREGIFHPLPILDRGTNNS